MMKISYLSLCVLVLALCISPPAAAAGNATPKSVVLDLSLDHGVLDVIGSRVVNNYPPDNRASKAIVIRLLDAKDALLAEQGIDDPRVIYLEEGAVVADTVNFSVIVAFRSDLAYIRLLNGTSSDVMVTADVSKTVNGYCNTHAGDTDCAVPGPDLTRIAVIAIIVVLLAVAVWFLLKRRTKPEQKPPAP